MAINKRTLRTRALTALIFVLLMFAGLFINAYTFISLFSVIMFGCLYEFSKLIKKISAKKYFFYLPLAFLYIILPIILLLDMGLNPDRYLNFSTAKNSALHYSSLLPCVILFSLWINDTMAYLVGSMMGKTTFSKISPAKTWEGTAGGAVLCITCMTLIGVHTAAGKILSLRDWICISGICTIFGTLGDLLESKLKRMAGIKDSGSIMPGHGGFLDRFDSLLLAIPFVWIYITLFL